MLTLPEKIAFFLILAASLWFSYQNFSSMIRIIRRGSGQLWFDHPIKRVTESLSVFLTQKTVLKNRPLVSFIHSLIAWAFTLYILVNIGDILSAYFPDFVFMGRGFIGNLYRFFVDLFSVAALTAVLFFIWRRFIAGSVSAQIRENVLVYKNARQGIRRDSLIVAGFIFLHIGFRFLGESVHLSMSGVDSWQPLASLLSPVFSALPGNMQVILHHLFWWLALGLILVFIPYFPFSKHLHLFMGPLNYLTRPERSAYGTMERLDFENESIEQFGAARITDLEQTSLVDAFACIQCNRCQEVCPAYLTGKELSPSALEINKRYFIREKFSELAGGQTPDENFFIFGLTTSALWACTTCAACVEVCPVGNEPMMDILNIRRDRVLMESEFPKQLQTAFTGMERNGNPWNRNEDRLAWAREDAALKVPTVAENPGFEILYWVGCAGAFDQKGQRVARAFASILNKAGVNFAVLGNEESCTGDSARRAGNEYLFASLAGENVTRLNKAGVKKIVTTCPHCLHTLKNEYSQFGGNYTVIHHTELIGSLLDTQKIVPSGKDPEQVTFHDPCYLGRHNRVFESPRQGLKTAGLKLTEMEHHSENSLCCGAGGAQMWKEEEAGTDAVRRVRLAEANQTGSSLLATGCPFCLTMLTDARVRFGSGILPRSSMMDSNCSSRALAQR